MDEREFWLIIKRHACRALSDPSTDDQSLRGVMVALEARLPSPNALLTIAEDEQLVRHAETIPTSRQPLPSESLVSSRLFSVVQGPFPSLNGAITE